MAWVVAAFRIWRLPVLRSFWSGSSPMSPPGPGSRLTLYKGTFDVAEGTHPQAVMHEVLSRVSVGWHGRQKEWVVVSALPFKEVPGIANNVSAALPLKPCASLPATVAASTRVCARARGCACL